MNTVVAFLILIAICAFNFYSGYRAGKRSAMYEEPTESAFVRTAKNDAATPGGSPKPMRNVPKKRRKSKAKK